MSSKKLEFALTQLKSDQWGQFERFASEFLCFDYPNIRTVAAGSGDLGRDAELFSPDGDLQVMIQYSLRGDWKTKIRQTAKRIRENFGSASILVYVTNQKIGADADDLKKEIRKEHKLILDIHDSSWFLERYASSDKRGKISMDFVNEIVGSILRFDEGFSVQSPALNTSEAKTAALHLQLQWEDDSREKGLSKLSYEAVIKSALNRTNSENRTPKETALKTVQKLLSAHSPEVVQVHFDSALGRLIKKGEVKLWKGSNELCLSHGESERIAESVAERGVLESTLSNEICNAVRPIMPDASPEIIELIGQRVRRIIDIFLLAKGEEFAAALADGRPLSVDGELIDIIITNDFAEKGDDTSLGELAVSATRVSTREMLQRSSDAVQAYLRKVADGYTLFGFLRAMPDVQKAMQKVFSDGEIWLDTSVILPMMAESILPSNSQIVSRLLRAAEECGIKLKVTNGVIEEVERHINRCLAYLHTTPGNWLGGVPFLYAMYSLQAKPREGFTKWVENFRGELRPLDDVAHYLGDEWGIDVEDLHDYVESAPERLRWEVERIWREAHEARRKKGFIDYDDSVITKLTNHDVECYLGVVGKRRDGVAENLGYKYWWLTLDRSVRDFTRELKSSLGNDAPKPPVMSPDFLADYIAFGPQRARLSKESESSIPVSFFDALSDHIPPELIQIAEELRLEYGADCERVLRRKLRDSLDGIRARSGKISAGGFAEIRERIETEIRALKL